MQLHLFMSNLRQSGERIWHKEKRLCSLVQQVKRWSVVFIFNNFNRFAFVLGTCDMSVVPQTAKRQEAICRSWLVEELYRMLFQRCIWVLSCS